MDINSKHSDWIKGIGDDQVGEYARFFRPHWPLTLPSNVIISRQILDVTSYIRDNPWYTKYHYLDRPRRTNILAVSKVLSEEALEVMYRTNYFIFYCGHLPSLAFCPLKEDMAVESLKDTPQHLSFKYLHHSRLAANASVQKFLPDMRFLILDFDLRELSIKSSDFVQGTRSIFENGEKKPRSDRFLQMIDLLKACKKIHSLRISVAINTESNYTMDRIPLLMNRLSSLRGILSFEVMVCYEYMNYEDGTCGGYTLTSNYIKYLESVTRKKQGTAVDTYEGQMLEEIPLAYAYEDDEDSQEDKDYSKKLQKRILGHDGIEAGIKEGFIPWWYRSIPTENRRTFGLWLMGAENRGNSAYGFEISLLNKGLKMPSLVPNLLDGALIGPYS